MATLLAAAATPWAPPSVANVVYGSPKGIVYNLNLPQTFEQAPKPVKTHLYEALWKGPRKGTQVGMSVDQVKIGSLKEFGSADTVAERVVAAEETRDGVFRVDLVGYFAQEGSTAEEEAYTVEYASQGSRGNKHFLCKFAVRDHRLWVLQASSLEADFELPELELRAIVDSFGFVDE